jgi:prophage antirepressor-like protein
LRALLKGAPYFVGNDMAARAGSKDSRRKRITKLLAEVEKRLDLENSKVTLADFIRLTQLERELEDEEQPKEIIVTWQDPAEKRCESQ